MDKFTQNKEDIRIWNRWGYNFFNREIICYTDKIIDFNDKEDRWEITYKPKMWISKITLPEFFAFFKDKDLRKTFRWKACEGDWFTEYEKAEHNDEGKIYIPEDSSLNLFRED